MSSRGKTVAGTDGTDHTFRERIADQYRVSAKYKSKLKMVCFLQLILLIIIFAHLFQNDWGVKLTNYHLPNPRKWEYVLMLTLFTNVIGYSSLSKNSQLKMYIYMWGTGLIGVGSVAWGAYTHYPEMAALVTKGINRTYLFGYPFVAVVYLLLAISLALQILGISYGFSLVNAWKGKTKKQ